MKPVFKLSLLTILGFTSCNILPVDKPAVPQKNTKIAVKEAVNTKIAFINLNALLPMSDFNVSTASHEWRDLMLQLQDTLIPGTNELKQIEESYMKKCAEYESMQKTGVSSPDASRRKAEEIMRLEPQIQEKRQKYQKLITDEMKKIQEIVVPKIDSIIADIRIKQGWDMIARSEALMAADPRLDLTEQVVEILNKEYAQVKAKKEKEQTKAPAGQAPKAFAA